MDLRKDKVRRARTIGIVITVLGFLLIGLVTALIRNGFGDHYFDIQNVTEEQLFSEEEGKDLLTGTTSKTKDGITTREMHVKRLTGLKLVETLKTGRGTVDLTVDSVLYGGDLRIFVIKNNAEIVKEIPVNTTDTFTIEARAADVFTVKMVGSDADLKIKVIYSIEK